MARPKKQGIDYFPLDVSFFSDVKIRKITRGCGVNSTSILICLLCNIYKDNGYYILWDEDLPFVIADTVGVSEGAVKEVMLKALQVGFFDQSLYERYKILTSKGIQSRFKAAVYKREEIEYIADYLVSDVQNSITDVQNGVNDTGSTQSKVKVKRKKDSKKESPNGDEKEGKPSSCAHPDYLKFQDWIKRKAPFCSNPKNFPVQITESEFFKLKAKYTGQEIADTIEQIENRKDLRKRYTNLYRTVLNWAKKEYEK
jgi:hypothetical protein